MKLQKLWMVGLVSLLIGCGHGFEGEYHEQMGSSIEFLDAFAQVAGGKAVYLGPDYLDADGVRTEFKDIFVRESGSQQYLIFVKADNSEDAWKIKDADTLVKEAGLVSVTLKRIHSEP